MSLFYFLPYSQSCDVAQLLFQIYQINGSLGHLRNELRGVGFRRPDRQHLWYRCHWRQQLQVIGLVAHGHRWSRRRSPLADFLRMGVEAGNLRSRVPVLGSCPASSPQGRQLRRALVAHDARADRLTDRSLCFCAWHRLRKVLLLRDREEDRFALVVAAKTSVIILVPLGPHVELLDGVHALAWVDAPLVDVAVPRVKQVKVGVLPGVLLALLADFLVKDDIERDMEDVLEEIGQDVLHFLVVQGERRVRVHLDEPDAEVLIDHEVESEQLVAVPTVGRVHFLLSCKVAVEAHVLHAGDEVSLDIELILWEHLLKVGLKVLETDYVSLLMTPIRLLVFDLQAVVREMHALDRIGRLFRLRVDQVPVPVRHVAERLHLLQLVLGARRAQIARLVEVEVATAVSEAPDPYVKLPRLVEQWPLQVLLDDPVRELQRSFDESGDVRRLVEDLDALALVLVRWLHEPDVVPAVLRRHDVGDSRLSIISFLLLFDRLKKLQKLLIFVSVQL